MSLLISCSEQEPPAEAEATKAEPAAVDQITPQAVQPIDQGATTTAISDPNPPHGEPGHRCEIPVGASLSTAPTPAASIATSPVINTTPVPGGPAAATEVVTAPGMNPPHGQPGHDCAVPVGSPLPK